MKRIKIPSAHVVIEWAAFSFCDSLISVELPEGLQVIGVGWFYTTAVDSSRFVTKIFDSSRPKFFPVQASYDQVGKTSSEMHMKYY
jgi:hypothetical protein